MPRARTVGAQTLPGSCALARVNPASPRLSFPSCKPRIITAQGSPELGEGCGYEDERVIYRAFSTGQRGVLVTQTRRGQGHSKRPRAGRIPQSAGGGPWALGSPWPHAQGRRGHYGPQGGLPGRRLRLAGRGGEEQSRAPRASPHGGATGRGPLCCHPAAALRISSRHGRSAGGLLRHPDGKQNARLLGREPHTAHR